MTIKRPFFASPRPEAYKSAEEQQAALAERDPLAAALIRDIAGFHPDHLEHRQAQARLEAYLALNAAAIADRNGRAITRATWVLTGATVVLAAATVALIFATLAA